MSCRQWSNVLSSCKCAFTNLFVNVTLKTRDGKRVKSWDVSGVQNIEEVLYFLWRELFLCMVASDAKRRTESIQDMLEEIDDLLGWTALERILYGGKKCECCKICGLAVAHTSG